MGRTRRITVAVVVVVLFGAIAVGISQRGNSSLASSARDAAANSARASGGDLLPSFAGPLFGGGMLHSSEIEGPAVIHVLGSWCPTCKGEAPAFAKLQRAHPELSYYYVAVEDDEDALAGFLEQYGLRDAPAIDDAHREVEDAFGLTGQPHTLFVDADGDVTIHQGPGTFPDLDELAQAIA